MYYNAYASLHFHIRHPTLCVMLFRNIIKYMLHEVLSCWLMLMSPSHKKMILPSSVVKALLPGFRGYILFSLKWSYSYLCRIIKIKKNP